MLNIKIQDLDKNMHAMMLEKHKRMQHMVDAQVGTGLRGNGAGCLPRRRQYSSLRPIA